jgi:hypothetical protein
MDIVFLKTPAFVSNFVSAILLHNFSATFEKYGKLREDKNLTQN